MRLNRNATGNEDYFLLKRPEREAYRDHLAARQKYFSDKSSSLYLLVTNLFVNFNPFQ